MKITNMPIDSIIPYTHNAKEHPEWQIDQIVKSIQEFGFNDPIAVDEAGVIIEGHGRYFAAIKLGMEEIPVIILSHMTDEQKKAYILAHNKLTMNTGFNTEILDLELGDISGIDMSDFGFDLGIDDVEVNGLTDPDDIPEEAPPVCKPGQVWQLGKHRLMCGDATKQDDVERLMDGKKADMVFTDPPYGIKRDKGFGGSDGFGGSGKPIKRRTYVGNDWDNDIPPKSFFDSLLQKAEKILLFGGNFFSHLLPQGRHWIVWDKKNTMPTFGDAELIWTNIKRNSVKIKEYQYNGLIGKEKERFHPTQKPVALMEDLITDYSEEEDTILDPFLGSGSTLIACEKTNRVCYGMEIDPHYCDVIIKRWEQFTGNRASLLLD